MIGTNADGLMAPCLEPEALLNLNDPSKYPVPLFDIGQPHHLTHPDGLKRDLLPLSHNPGLACHLGPYGHIIMLGQRCLDDNHMGRLGDVHRHYLAMNPIGPPAGCLTIRRNTEQHHQRSDGE